MKKGIIVFKGKYGATRQYAQWLGQELDLAYQEADQMTDELLSRYDFVIIGSSVYYGKLLLSSFLTKYFNVLKTKKLFVFIVCATPDSDEKTQSLIVKDNIPRLLTDRSNIFFLPGRMTLKKLSLTDRILLRVAAAFEKDPQKKQGMLNGIDGVCKENLIDLIIAASMYSLVKPNSHSDLKRSGAANRPNF
jgi:menaquinone-dependent protoporphyrinogen IX oxidase